MIYCLMTEDKTVRVEIECSLKNKPENLAQLYVRCVQGSIKLIKPTRGVSGKWASKLYGELELITDWERTGAQARYINWISP